MPSLAHRCAPDADPRKVASEKGLPRRLRESMLPRLGTHGNTGCHGLEDPERPDNHGRAGAAIAMSHRRGEGRDPFGRNEHRLSLG